MASELTARLAARPSIVPIPVRVPAAADQLPPQHTAFVGREDELVALRTLLSSEDVRQVTLTGPGGIGKTRLAIRVAEVLAPDFGDGVAFVALAGIREPEQMLPAIYQALGGRDTGSDFSRDRLYQVLEGRALLMVLDNVEHLLAAAAAIADLLTASPRLKIVSTSRSALQLSGEHEFLVPPLALPALTPIFSEEELLQAATVRLFVQRARAVRPGFVPTNGDLGAIGAICHRLDGFPLAIELAAARITHLSPQAILARLEQPGTAQLPLLTGGLRDQPARHHTMRDTIAWSYDLLNEAERTLFQRLSVFVGGFTLEAAEAVGGDGFAVGGVGRGEQEVATACSDLSPLSAASPPTAKPSPPERGVPPSTLDLLASLVAKSLVRYEGDWGGEPRYGMFETMREYAREQLVASGQEATARRQHAVWALALAERAGPRVRGTDAAVWLEALEREHANLRAALAWLAEGRAGTPLIRLAVALSPFWQDHAHFAEGRHWLEVALALGRDAPARDRLRALCGAGTMARHHADFVHGIARHEQALALARELGDREEEATILHNLGTQATDLGDFAQARARLEAAIAIAREAGTPRPMIRALHGLAQIQRVELESAAALRSLEEVLALVRAHQMTWIVPYLVTGIALTATDLGDFERAIGLFHETITEALGKGNLGHVVDGIEGLARVAAATGQAERSARLYGAAEAQREQLTFTISPTEIAYAAPVMQALRAALGPDRFAAVWAEGRRLTREEALAEAFAIRVGVAGGAAARRTAHGLTEREREVLRLLAAGHSNRDIADLLFISEATAARHMANIYGKLAVDSRTKAAAFAHQHGLI